MLGMLVAEGDRQDWFGVKQFAVNSHKVVPRPLQAIALKEPLPAQFAKLRECPFDSSSVSQLG